MSAISVLGNFIFDKIIERFRNLPILHSLPVSENFKKLAFDPSLRNLADFLKMKESDFKESFAVLAETNLDDIIAYLCNFKKIKDYHLIQNDIPPEKIKSKLREIFGNTILENTLSIISVKTFVKLYKKEQKLNIKNGNRIMDLTECTNLIKPQEVLELNYVFFNPELLRLELGMSVEEFKKYELEIKRMMEELNKKPEEFELKYIVDENVEEDNFLNQILDVFIKNGFAIISTKEKQNNDEYYDTKNLDLYKSGSSLRIRKVKNKNKEKIEATFKKPLGLGEVYSSRNEIKEEVPDDTFETFKQKMLESHAEVDFATFLRFPILNSITNRNDVILEKNGVQVCLSFDKSRYTNHTLNEISANDRMIEIEAIGELSDRVILNEIHEFVTAHFSCLAINKQSKYERGINLTLELYNLLYNQEPGTEDPSYNSITTKPDVGVVVKKLTNDKKYISE